jgi:hypothetical protein
MTGMPPFTTWPELAGTFGMVASSHWPGLGCPPCASHGFPGHISHGQELLDVVSAPIGALMTCNN